MDARTRVAGGDGEPRLEVTGVEDGELLHKRDDHDAPVHGDIGDLGVELDVVYLEGFNELCNGMARLVGLRM